MTSVRHAVGQFPALSPLVAFCVLCAYAIGTLVIGEVLMSKRDAS
jgi:hypothetical protein